jgi:hypothetical protein
MGSQATLDACLLPPMGCGPPRWQDHIRAGTAEVRPHRLAPAREQPAGANPRQGRMEFANFGLLLRAPFPVAHTGAAAPDSVSRVRGER